MNKQVVNDKDEKYFIQKRHPDYYTIPNGKIAKSMMYNSYKDANAIMAKRNAGASGQLAGDRFNTVVDNELLRLINQLEIIEKNF
tara:strand:- start:3260 stop:3514 length:255 start_codon:yes stop_codon:yes gene_type:complete